MLYPPIKKGLATAKPLINKGGRKLTFQNLMDDLKLLKLLELWEKWSFQSYGVFI